MRYTKIHDIENDGLNMAVDESFLYVRCKRAMHKYNLADMSESAQNTIFKKDGKARGFSIGDDFVFLFDFCDLYVIHKRELMIADVIRLGENLSSDICGVRSDAQNAFIAIRNGEFAVLNLKTKGIANYRISDSSTWEFTISGDCLYIGTVKGELFEVRTEDMQTLRKAELCKKNIYSTLLCGDFIYTVSQDMTIKAISVESFEVISVAKKAVKGMARILGVYRDILVVADRNVISLWDKQTLQLHEKFDFPTGQFNKGALLFEKMLIGSDFTSIYMGTL